MSDSEDVMTGANDSRIPSLPRLSSMKKFVFWTEQSGVIVSPNCYELPNMPSPAEKHKDMGIRHVVTNSTVYELFYPRLVVNRGPLFGRLDISPSQLFNMIIELPHTFTGPMAPLMGDEYRPMFSLPDELISSWSRLENALIETASYLLRTHKDGSHFHPITFPKLPWQHGYRQPHFTKANVVRCTLRAKDAFAMLSAVVTFALSLWLTREKATCFTRAFRQLSYGPRSPGAAPEWLSLLEDSYVCNLSSAMRTGGFLNPYDCAWSHWIPHFVAAGVPLWFVWGHNFNARQSIKSEIRDHLFPDEVAVEEAQLKSKFHPLNIAYVETPPLLYSQYTKRNREEDGVPPIDHRSVLHSVERGSRQRPGEFWGDFLERMKQERIDWMACESIELRNIREEREDRSSNGLWMGTSAVFEWQMEGDFWRRIRVDRCDISLRWGNYAPNQRIFHGHLNEWDLCPQLDRCGFHEDELQDHSLDLTEDPVYPCGVDYNTEINNSLYVPDDPLAKENLQTNIDNDLNDMSSMMQSGPPSSNSRAIVGEAPELSSGSVDSFGPSDFLDYLKLRHGFTATENSECALRLHGRTDSEGTAKSYSDVAKRLNYSIGIPQKSFQNSILDFNNIIVNPRIGISQLPPSWDISRRSSNPVNLSRSGFTLSVLDNPSDFKLFVIRPSETVLGDWVIATHDPTTILLAYRLRWDSLQQLVRQLLRRGVAFYMPRYIQAKDLGRPTVVIEEDSRGLGWRAIGFEPKGVDLRSYIVKKHAELRSGNGRCCRLVGGIVARLASELVTEEDVLGGPIYCDKYLAEVDQDNILADDEISTEVLDIVCGVYYSGFTNGMPHILSWWPRNHIWKTKSGFNMGEWSPDAEVWYQKRCREIEEKKNVLNSSQWKQNIRRYQSKNSVVLDASRFLSKEFIREQTSNP